MTPEQFCYWLQGFFEITEAGKPLNAKQMRIVEAHLKSVFDPKIADRLHDSPLVAPRLPGQWSDIQLTDPDNKPTHIIC